MTFCSLKDYVSVYSQSITTINILNHKINLHYKCARNDDEKTHYIGMENIELYSINALYGFYQLHIHVHNIIGKLNSRNESVHRGEWSQVVGCVLGHMKQL